jgi:hypothetical protein
MRSTQGRRLPPGGGFPPFRPPGHKAARAVLRCYEDRSGEVLPKGLRRPVVLRALQPVVEACLIWHGEQACRRAERESKALRKALVRFDRVSSDVKRQTDSAAGPLLGPSTRRWIVETIEAAQASTAMPRRIVVSAVHLELPNGKHIYPEPPFRKLLLIRPLLGRGNHRPPKKWKQFNKWLFVETGGGSHDALEFARGLLSCLESLVKVTDPKQLSVEIEDPKTRSRFLTDLGVLTSDHDMAFLRAALKFPRAPTL